MDAELRDVIRADDPMAAYALKQQAKAAAAAGKPAKPVYKGPAPKPNRYIYHSLQILTLTIAQCTVSKLLTHH
jgi:Pre-mRNA-splicing factor of RES complex